MSRLNRAPDVEYHCERFWWKATQEFVLGGDWKSSLPDPHWFLVRKWLRRHNLTEVWWRSYATFDCALATPARCRRRVDESRWSVLQQKRWSPFKKATATMKSQEERTSETHGKVTALRMRRDRPIEKQNCAAGVLFSIYQLKSDFCKR